MRSTFMRASALGGLIMAGSLMLPVSAAAASSLTFYVPPIGGPCLDVTAPPDETLSLVWKDSGGTVKDTASFQTGDVGDTNLLANCRRRRRRPFEDQRRLGDAQARRPEHDGPDSDRVTDVMRGTAQPELLVFVSNGRPSVRHDRALHMVKECDRRQRRQLEGPDPWDIFGGWVMYAHWRNAPGDVVYVKATAPWFEVFLGQARFVGVSDPGATARVQLRFIAHREGSRKG